MSMSLDGFITGPNDSPANPGGDGFMRLHDWFHDVLPSRVELDIVRVIDTPEATHIRYCIRR